jgi:hypothetical protein
MTSRRAFWLAVAALLAYLATVQIRSAMQESVTVDEPVELASGYTYLTTGDFRMEPVHPPLDKMFAALPLLRFGIVPPRDPTPWLHGDEIVFGTQWLAANARKEDAMVLAARLTSIFLTSCLGLAMALWTRAAFGPTAALLALALYAFDPTITAHGHYVKNDVPFALSAFLACIAFGAFVKRPSLPRLLLAALALGLAMVTKLAAFFLLPVFVLLYAVWRWQGHKSLSLRRGILSLAAIVALSGVVVFLTYEIPALLQGVKTGGVNRGIVHALFDRSAAGATARLTGGAPPAHPFLRGFVELLDLNAGGHPSYLLGKVRTHGWWYYFPIAFAVKTPVATLVFLALAAWICLKKLRHGAMRRVAFDWFVLAIPVAVYSAFSLATPINVGVRHLLPIFPFLFILSAAAFTRARWRHAWILLLVLGAGLIAESISIYPHYLAFFNVLAGGPSHGPMILADSNIDWGQDAKNLAVWLHQHPPSRLCLDYWGTADLAHLGIAGPSLMDRMRTEGRIPRDCIAAVSVNFLTGLSPDHGQFGWLRSLPPLARIGYSIYIFDLAKSVPIAASLLSTADRPAFQSVWHQDFRGAPTAKDPAIPGEILVFYMTGLGPVSEPPPLGRPAPLDILSSTLAPLFCQWDAAAGGPIADVLFAGLAPGRTGVYQVNVRVAPNVASGQLTCRSALFSAGESQGASMLVPVAARVLKTFSGFLTEPRPSRSAPWPCGPPKVLKTRSRLMARNQSLR